MRQLDDHLRLEEFLVGLVSLQHGSGVSRHRVRLQKEKRSGAERSLDMDTSQSMDSMAHQASVRDPATGCVLHLTFGMIGKDRTATDAMNNPAVSHTEIAERNPRGWDDNDCSPARDETIRQRQNREHGRVETFGHSSHLRNDGHSVLEAMVEGPED